MKVTDEEEKETAFLTCAKLIYPLKRSSCLTGN